MQHTNITYTKIMKEGTQKAYKLWEGVINDLIEEKQKIKGQKINGMEITGIGQKCLKLENNFIKWDDIFDNFYYEDEETTSLDETILEFIFEDYTAKKQETYTAKKWSRTEAIENFEEIKEDFMQTITQENEIGEELRETILKNYDSIEDNMIRHTNLKHIGGNNFVGIG